MAHESPSGLRDEFNSVQQAVLCACCLLCVKMGLRQSAKPSRMMVFSISGPCRLGIRLVLKK